MRNFSSDLNKSAVERLAEIRIEIEAAKLEKLRAEAAEARAKAEPPKYTPYEDYPPPSPEDRAKFIARIQKMLPAIDDFRNPFLQALARDNPDIKLDLIQAMLIKASNEASQMARQLKADREAEEAVRARESEPAHSLET